MMLAGCLLKFRRFCLCSTTLTLLLAQSAHAQIPSLRGSTTSASEAVAPVSPTAPRSSSAANSSAATAASAPRLDQGFRAGGAVNLSESYVRNTFGTAGIQQPDYLTTFTL